MDLEGLRLLLAAGSVRLRIALHAKIEARKDGLTEDDLEAAVQSGEAIEDYGSRSLLLAWAEGGRLPYHVVLEYVPSRREVVVVSAYVPDPSLWSHDFRTRQPRRRR